VTTADVQIGEWTARLTHVDVRGDRVALWRVADLERHVDRVALLAADDPPEPPYWAHLWSGAVVLARALRAATGRVLELGCGLGLPGLVAARRGARVTFVDRVPAPLAFVRASAAANAIRDVEVVAADATGTAIAGRFDLVLAAELVYDRATFAPLAAALARLVTPGGRALVTDAGRTDTRAFYAALDAVDLVWRATAEEVREDGLPVTVRTVEIAHPRPYFSSFR
jgi:predicted nicotinamide N-methyase